MIPKSIKNIIFDLGGVIIDIDPELTFKAFEKLSSSIMFSTTGALDTCPFFSNFERGLMSSDDFIGELLKLCEDDTTEMEVLDSWNAILLDISKEKRDLLLQLKSEYNIVLLSNTNEIHRLWIDDFIEANFSDNGLHSWFNEVYTSYELNLQKPEPEIFKYVLNHKNLVAEETLFIDDTEKHIKSAQNLGIQTILATESNTIIQIFE